MSKNPIFLFFSMALIGLAGLSCSSTSKSVQEESIRVISYNIRYHNPDDGENAWSERKAEFVDKINEYSPDVLGVQEALHDQMLDLERGLDGYAVIGSGRDDGQEKGEYCGILVRDSDFKVLDSGQFWLSPEPNKIGSVGWDASLTRIATWAILESQNDGSEIFVLNGHFDHRGEEARTESAKLIVQKTKDLAGGRQAIVLGDFNANPESEAYQHFVGSPDVFQLEDSYLTCLSKQGHVGTFQGFTKREDTQRRIDYVFLSEGISCQAYDVPADLISGQRYYSDHLPVIVDIRF